MNINALNWYRKHSNFTENSKNAQRVPLLYFDTQNVPGGRNRFVDFVKAKSGLEFFGTPGEYGAQYKASKYISVVSPPDKGKIMFTDYPGNTQLTATKVFPGTQQNDNATTDASPFHMVKLYFVGRASLSLDVRPNSNNYKQWY